MNSLYKLGITLFFLSTTASAQTFTQPGTVELGGDISFSSQTSPSQTNGGSTTILSFGPYVGFMLSSGFELGLMPGISYMNESTFSGTQLNLFIAPSYNFGSGESTHPYLEFLLGYNSVSYQYKFLYSNSFGLEAGGLGIGFDAGMKFNLQGNSLMLFKIQYLHQSFVDSRVVQSGINAEQILNTLSFGMGFRVFLEGKVGKK